MTTRAAVVGGGLGGALAARALRLRGVDVEVVDAADTPGGVATAIHRHGYLLEPAAGTILHPHPQLAPLLDGLALGLRPARHAARRQVHAGGRTETLRPGPGLLRTRLVSAGAKLRALGEPLVAEGSDTDETVGRFFRRRFGTEAGELAAWLASAGVHAGDPERLSIQAAFPMLAALERSHGSVVGGMLARRRGPRPRMRPAAHVVDGGIAAIAAAVADEVGEGWHRSRPAVGLHADGDVWRVETEDGAVEADRVVLALPAPGAAELLGGEAGAELSRLESAPVAVVWLGLLGDPLPDAIGTLVGPHEGFDTLGFLYESSFDPARAPEGRSLVKAITGGAVRSESVRLSDAELVERVVGELERVLAAAVDVEFSHVVRHHPGIPQYTAVRRGVMARLARSLPPGIDLAGWEYDGVGLSQIASSVTALADRIVWEA